MVQFRKYNEILKMAAEEELLLLNLVQLYQDVIICSCVCHRASTVSSGTASHRGTTHALRSQHCWTYLAEQLLSRTIKDTYKFKCEIYKLCLLAWAPVKCNPSPHPRTKIADKSKTNLVQEK